VVVCRRSEKRLFVTKDGFLKNVMYPKYIIINGKVIIKLIRTNKRPILRA